MALPQTNYIDAGPGVPLANPGSAMIQGKAYAEMGNTIAAIGERGMEIAGKLRDIDDTRKATDLWMRMEKENNDFQIGLMTREDTTKWPEESAKMAEKWKEESKKLGLSAAGQSAFEERFTQWNTRRSIGLETQAATKGIELAKMTAANASQFHLSNRNYDGARQVVRDHMAVGILGSAEGQKAMMEIDSIQRHDDIMEDIEEDPVGWMDTHKEPLPGYDRTKWNQMQAHARSAARAKTYDVAGKVQDRIVSGKLTTPEQVREAAGGLRPTEQVELEGFLSKWNEAERDNLRNDPEFQAGLVGEFERQLADYKPAAGDDEDMPGVRLGGLVAMMPAGPLRDDMERRLKYVGENQKVEAQTQLDLMLDQVTAYAKQGKFGAVPETKFSTEQRVRGGLLRNEQALKDAGFSDDHVKKFKEAKSDNEREQLVRDLWTSRGMAKKDIDQFTWQSFDAIHKGESSFEFGADAAAAKQAEIDIKLGSIRTHMKEWTRLNPEAARDPAKIQAELHKFTGLEIRQPQSRMTPKPAPPTGKETSMNGGLINMVKELEGFYPKAYSDYKQWSVGYGTKGKPGETITKDEAERRLTAELSSAKQDVMRATAGLNLKPNQIDALTSFHYNTGSVAKLVEGRSPEQIAEAMLLYTKAGGKPLDGLKRRREAERQLFLS